MYRKTRSSIHVACLERSYCVSHPVAWEAWVFYMLNAVELSAAQTIETIHASSVIRLFLLRHGPTTASANGAPLGHLDLPVSEEGQAHWPQVRAELLSLGIQRVVSSDLRRAREHAEDLGLPLHVLQDLREQNFGDWDGIPWSELQDTEAFFADPVHGVPPGGESFAQCAERTKRAILNLPDDASTLLVLAHGGPLRAIFSHYLGVPLERVLDIAWQPFGLTRLDVYQIDKAVLQFHNRPAG